MYADDTAIIFSADTNINLQMHVNNFFTRYHYYCMSNCIVVNPIKSNFLLYNSENIMMSINGQPITQTSSAKYLGVFVDDQLLWTKHVSHITSMCCQRIGVFRKVLPMLPSYVVALYYNAFIRSCFSYCLMFWINNDRSGRHKLFNKVDNLIVKLNTRNNGSDLENVWTVHKLQCLSFMHDISSNVIV